MRVLSGAGDPEEGIEWSVVDWKDTPTDVLDEIDHLLQSFGLQIVKEESGDAILIGVEKRP